MLEALLRKRVKIVCTMGPAVRDEGVLREMVLAGMNVARLNFSHGDYETHGRYLRMVRSLEEELKLPLPVMLDTKGPEIRTGLLKDRREVVLREGQLFSLVVEDVLGDESRVSVSYKDLPREVAPGQEIFLDDGTIGLVVEEVRGGEIVCRVVNGGVLGERKGVNVPGADLSVPVLSEKDVQDIKWGVDHDVDYIAVSFVRSRDDVIAVKKVLEEFRHDVKIIAKIETRQAVKNLQEILEVSDGVMVARGDLGVELPTEQVPVVQKCIVDLARRAGKPVIVATQMLESMIGSPRPTRAEASDVANAVIDGADAVMLSGETARGKYPVEAVRTMARIIEHTEKNRALWERPFDLPAAGSVPDSISHASVTIASEMRASAIVTLSRSGTTLRMVAKYRPRCPIISSTPVKKVWREMSLVWGAIPLLAEDVKNVEDAIENTLALAQEEGLIKEGDLVVVTAGLPVGIPGTTNLIQVQTVGKVLVRGMSILKKQAVGRVAVAMSAEEALSKVKEGDVLVARSTDRGYVPAMQRACAVVVEEGGLTSHAAIVCLELKIPCIVGASGATSLLQDGMIVTIDGERGLVYQGKVKLGR